MRRILLLLALIVSCASPAFAQDAIDVTFGSSYSFALNGVPLGTNPGLTLQIGRTYTINVNVPSIHPFEITTPPPPGTLCSLTNAAAIDPSAFGSTTTTSSGTIVFTPTATLAALGGLRYTDAVHCGVYGNIISLVAPPPPDPTLVLFPRVECVMPDVMDPSSSIIMFGYEDVGTDTVQVPFGPTNQVNINGTTGSIPGEPTSFVPGLYPFAFSARLTSGQATWTLGTRSVTGDTTTTACGLRGPKGDSGLTGVAGANGLDGAAGPKGDTGPAGATGPQGPIGATGSQGAPGLNGLPGATGAEGPIGLGLGFEIRRISANTTATWPDGSRSLVYLATTSGANVIVTLPAAATSANRFITVRRVDGGREVRVRPAAGETIDGDTGAIAMATKDQYVTLVSDGVEWAVFAQQ